MEVFVCIIEDRHCDVCAEVFDTRDAAVAFAKEFCEDRAHDPEDLEEFEIYGWEYCCHYSCESDKVHVVKTELRKN